MSLKFLNIEWRLLQKVQIKFTVSDLKEISIQMQLNNSSVANTRKTKKTQRNERLTNRDEK